MALATSLGLRCASATPARLAAVASHHLPAAIVSLTQGPPVHAVTTLRVFTLTPRPAPADSDASSATMAWCLDEHSAEATLERAALHVRFGVSADRPLMRTNAAVWTPRLAPSSSIQALRAGGVGGPVLLSVHEGLAPSGVGGSVHLVQGPYLYYHYMQQGFNDRVRLTKML